MYIHGIGALFAGGRGRAAFEKAVEAGSSEITAREVAFWDRPLPVFRVPKEALREPSLARVLRRADRFSRMAVIAGRDAVKDSGGSATEGLRTGVIVATALGPHVTNFQFIDDMRDYGLHQASPTTFSYSLHGTAASSVASILGLVGPVHTVTDFFHGFQQGLMLARLWLDEDRCDRVLLGTVDELGTILEYVFSRKTHIAEEGKLDPLGFSERSRAVPGEGALFLVLSKASRGARAEVRSIDFGQDDPPRLGTEGFYIEADGLIGDESIYGSDPIRGHILDGSAPVFGSLLSGGGFHCAAALCKMNVSAQTLRYDCHGRWSSIALSRVEASDG